MSHIPSDSAACPTAAQNAQATNPVDSSSSSSSYYTFLAEPELGHGTSATLTQQAAAAPSSLSLLHNITITRRGILSGLLGAAPRHACFCGFDNPGFGAAGPGGFQCLIPQVIRTFLQAQPLPPTPDMQYLTDVIVTQQQAAFHTHQNERVQRTLAFLWPIAAQLPQQQANPWPCPDLLPSDHWGIVADTNNWLQSQVRGTLASSHCHQLIIIEHTHTDAYTTMHNH